MFTTGGGQKRGRTQRKHFKNSRENVWKKNRSETNDNNGSNGSNNNNGVSNWDNFTTTNTVFDDYYKEQKIVPEDEWDKFVEVLRKPLPSAFRINSSGQFFEDIRSQLENDFMKSLESEVIDGDEEKPIRPLPWYPGNLAWQSNFSRMQLRKNQTLARFHEFLKQANEIGNITRQEAVSMVPPLFLDVQPDHYVLDMCAAPGSKTFQLLEMIHESIDFELLPSGMVIANDVDVQRCNLLIHQTKRMCSANLIVTNHEAQNFPSCHVKKALDTTKMGSSKGIKSIKLQFDRVLCDVPCSGDGTLRKAPDIWRKWNAGLGNGVHRLQVQIAMRGLAVLKVGGRMVYSTCSMNPIENEAVIAELLRRCGGAVELLDVSAELPELARRPGLNTWKVRDKGLWLPSYKFVPRYRRNAIVSGMFPSGSKEELETSDPCCLEDDVNLTGSEHGKGTLTSVETKNENGVNDESENGFRQFKKIMVPVDAPQEVSSFPLERCMRIVPHDQNSGAFFVAVLKKMSDLPVFSESTNSLNHRSTSGKTLVPMMVVDKTVEDSTIDLDTNVLEDDTIPMNSALAKAASDINLMDEDLDKSAIELNSDEIVEECHEQEEAKGNGDSKICIDTVKGSRKLQAQGKWRGVDPVVFFTDEFALNSIKTFYGIDQSFPLDDHLVARNTDAQRVKRIYYISESVRDVIKLNFSAGQQLKITSVGLKTFERQSSKEGADSYCAYRISSEGLPLLLPYITKQILQVPIADFKHLLQYKTIKFADFVDPEFREKVTELLLGCCVIVLNKGDKATQENFKVDASTVAIGCWKGKTNVSVMVAPTDCQELLGRLAVHFEKKTNPSEQESIQLNLESSTGTTPDFNTAEGSIESST